MMPDAQNIVIFQTDIKVSQGKMRSCKHLEHSWIERAVILCRSWEERGVWGREGGGEESGREWMGTGKIVISGTAEGLFFYVNEAINKMFWFSFLADIKIVPFHLFQELCV